MPENDCHNDFSEHPSPHIVTNLCVYDENTQDLLS